MRTSIAQKLVERWVQESQVQLQTLRDAQQNTNRVEYDSRRKAWVPHSSLASRRVASDDGSDSNSDDDSDSDSDDDSVDAFDDDEAWKEALEAQAMYDEEDAQNVVADLQDKLDMHYDIPALNENYYSDDLCALYNATNLDAEELLRCTAELRALRVRDATLMYNTCMRALRRHQQKLGVGHACASPGRTD